MANKRVATTELNHDNWNEDNDSEEAGTFVKASNDVLDKRILKTAKRRLSSRDVSVLRLSNILFSFLLLYLKYFRKL